MAPKKRNPFFRFMQKRKKELVAAGHNFPGGWKDVAQFLDTEWSAMSLEERSQYSDNPCSGGSGDGEKAEKNVCDVIAQNTREKLREECHINNEIASHVGADVIDTIFILMDFNIWCVSAEDVCIPAEFAIVAFSLKHGVIDQCSTLIDPGELPVGLAYRAGINIDKLMLPHPPLLRNSENFPSAMSLIGDFIERYTNERDPGFLFCRRENTLKIQSCFHWLTGQKGCPYKLYPFEFLVVRLSVVTTAAHIVRQETNEVDTYMYPDRIERLVLDGVSDEESEACCDYASHLLIAEESVNQILFSMENASLRCLNCFHHMRYAELGHECVLNTLNRTIYQVLKFLVVSLDVIPIAGVHFAADEIAEETDKRRFMLETWGIPDIEYESMETPDERQEKRRINAVLEAKRVRERPDEPLPFAHTALLFREKPNYPEFVADIPYAIEVEKEAPVGVMRKRGTRVRVSEGNWKYEKEEDEEDDGWVF